MTPNLTPTKPNLTPPPDRTLNPHLPNPYPDSDGKPMADNTLQYQWIVRLVTNLRHLLKNQTAFVAGDLLWYPTEAPFPAPAQAPDVLVALGRPPGDRGSYKQWQEDNIAPQVIFEILSPSNTGSEMAAKQTFYIQHGVLEMFFYDPQSFSFWGLVRTHPQDTPQPLMALQLPWTSPTLGIRLEMGTEGLAVFYPNGEPFKAPEELAAERDQITAQLAQTSQQLEQTSQQLEQTSHDRDRAFAKLRELGIDPATL